jgi:hypothetical protein
MEDVMQIGDTVTHKRYGKAVILAKPKKRDHTKFGVLLELCTKAGKAQARADRRGVMPKGIYEANLDFIVETPKIEIKI